MRARFSFDHIACALMLDCRLEHCVQRAIEIDSNKAQERKREISRNPPRRPCGRILRREGARSVPLAGGRRPRVARSGRVGEEAERSCPRVSRRHSAAAGNRKAAHRALELRALFAARRRKAASTSISKNDGLQNQSVLYVADSYKARRPRADRSEQVVEGRHDRAVEHSAPSDDGRLLAYARSEAGSDWQQIYVIDVETGKQLDDHLKWSRFSDIDWNKDGSGLLLHPLPRAAAGRAVSGGRPSTRWSTSTSWARSRQTTSSSTAGPIIPIGTSASAPTDDGKYLVLSICPQHRSAKPGARARRGRAGRRAVQGADRRLRQRVLVRRQRGHEVLLPHRSRCADEADRDDGHRPAGPRARDRNRAGRARRRSTASASSAAGSSCQYMVDVLTDVEVFDLDGQVARQDRAARQGHGRRFRRRPGRQGNVLRLHELQRADERLSVRCARPNKIGARAPAESEVRPAIVRRRASVLQKQGRHARADDARLSQGSCTEASPTPQPSNAALRLRRLQHFDDARSSSPTTSPGWKWAACWPWPTCAAAASTAKSGTWPARRSRSKTCSTTSSPPPNG